MPSESDVIAAGFIDEVLPAGTFRVKLHLTGAFVDAYLSGKMRQNSIWVVKGDAVEVAMSPYDLTKGRITRRF